MLWKGFYGSRAEIVALLGPLSLGWKEIKIPVVHHTIVVLKVGIKNLRSMVRTLISLLWKWENGLIFWLRKWELNILLIRCFSTHLLKVLNVWGEISLTHWLQEQLFEGPFFIHWCRHFDIGKWYKSGTDHITISGIYCTVNEEHKNVTMILKYIIQSTSWYHEQLLVHRYYYQFASVTDFVKRKYSRKWLAIMCYSSSFLYCSMMFQWNVKPV